MFVIFKSMTLFVRVDRSEIFDEKPSNKACVVATWEAVWREWWNGTPALMYVIVGHLNVERSSMGWKIDEMVQLSIFNVYFE